MAKELCGAAQVTRGEVRPRPGAGRAAHIAWGSVKQERSGFITFLTLPPGSCRSPQRFQLILGMCENPERSLKPERDSLVQT